MSNGNQISPVYLVVGYVFYALLIGNIIYFVYCILTGQDISWFVEFVNKLFNPGEAK